MKRQLSAEAAFKRARKNLARALANPKVRTGLRAQREAVRRMREGKVPGGKE